MAEGGAFRAFIEPVGIDERKREGEGAGALMMIDDDHVDARIPRHGQRIERLCAAIDGDDQRGAFGTKPHQRLARGAIAFHQPVGDIGAGGQAEIAQQADKERGAGRAIDIIVAEDGDRLARLHRVGDARGGALHVLKQARIGHERADRGQAMRLHIVPPTAARHEKLRHQIVRGEACLASVRSCAAPVPGLAKDRAGDVERGGHPSCPSGSGGCGKGGF